MKAFIVVAALLLLSHPAKAQGIDINQINELFSVKTGNDMVTGFEACDRTQQTKDPSLEFDTMICLHLQGYIEGIVDGVAATCVTCQIEIPSGIKYGQAFDVVRQYLTNHPESRQQTSISLIVLAFSKAWPKP